MRLEKIGNIKANPNNPRIIKDDKFKKLVKSIKEFPEMLNIRPIVVDSEMMVLGGNQRLKACIEAGLKEVPIIVADAFSEDQKKEFIVKDNIGYGEWDFDLLKVDYDVIVLEDWGLDLPEIGEEELVLEAEEDDFDTTPPEMPITVLGDLYEIGEHRLLCGDSTDSDSVAKLMNGNKADMVFTDPPYGMNFQSNFREKTPQFSKIKNDDKILDIAPILFFLMKDNSPAYVCTRWDLYPIWFNQMADCFNIKNCIVWYKKGGGLGDLKNSYSPNHEFIIVGHKGNSQLTGKRNSDVWEIGRDGVNDYKHPTQKPVELSSFAMQNHSYNNGLIVDLFLGSGSTMVAAHQLKRKCYGMELDCRYADVIVKRMLKLDKTLKIKKNGVDETEKWLKLIE